MCAKNNMAHRDTLCRGFCHDRTYDFTGLMKDLTRNTIADRIRKVNCRGSRFDHSQDHLVQKSKFTASKILAGKLNVRRQRACISNTIAGHLVDLLWSLCELAFHMLRTRRNERVDSSLSALQRRLKCFCCGRNHAPRAFSQSSDNRACALASDTVYSFIVLMRRTRKPRFDHINIH